MPGAPKPKKSDREKATRKRKRDLIAYRATQVKRAIVRDNDQCVFCWFLEDTITQREEVHHVYSRGREAGSWREKTESLLCTCKEHHPPAIQIRGGSATLGWVEYILQRANETPINEAYLLIGEDADIIRR